MTRTYPPRRAHHVGVRLGDDLADQVDRIAARERRSRSATIRLLLEEAIQHRSRSKKAAA